MSEWKPIASAPRNEYVLVYVNDTVCIGILWQGYRHWKSDGYAESSSAEQRLEPPTHWMPLPEPPK